MPSFSICSLSCVVSNEPCEGKINKLKYIKRPTHGRSSFEPLRQRVLKAGYLSTGSAQEPNTSFSSSYSLAGSSMRFPSLFFCSCVRYTFWCAVGREHSDPRDHPTSVEADTIQFC